MKLKGTMETQKSQQRGMALVEALIASAIVGIGLVGATQLTLKTLNTASQSRHHFLAQQLAQEAMDCLRATALMPAQVETDLCPDQEILPIQGVPYTRQAQIASGVAGNISELRVRVSWPESQTKNEGLIEWHSSVSVIPSWVGVSLP
jgi:Tfp pilus assembly protein PilV